MDCVGRKWALIIMTSPTLIGWILIIKPAGVWMMVYGRILLGLGCGVLFSIVCGIVPLIFMVTFCRMPQSPTYLIKRHRDEQAEKSLKWLMRGKNSSKIQLEMQEIIKEQDEILQQDRKEPLIVSLKKKQSIRALIGTHKNETTINI